MLLDVNDEFTSNFLINKSTHKKFQNKKRRKILYKPRNNCEQLVNDRWLFYSYSQSYPQYPQ